MAPKRRLGEILVEAGMIDDFQLRSALSDQKRWGRPLGVTLLKLGFIEEEELVRFLSRQLNVPIVDLEGKRISPEALAALSIQVAEKLRCIPLFKKRDAGREVLYLGMEDPTDLSTLDDLAFRTGLDIRPVLVGPNQLSEAIERYYHKLEWDGDEEPEAELEALHEPGDTAPFVFRPERPAADDSMQPEMLEPAQARAAQPETPLGEPEFSLPDREPAAPVAPEAAPEPEFLVDAEPRETPRDRVVRQERQRQAAPRELGPEFITDDARAPEPTLETPARPREVPTRTILRAVTRILVERGVFTREELLESINELVSGDEAASDE